MDKREENMKIGVTNIFRFANEENMLRISVVDFGKEAQGKWWLRTPTTMMVECLANSLAKGLRGGWRVMRELKLCLIIPYIPIQPKHFFSTVSKGTYRLFGSVWFN